MSSRQTFNGWLALTLVWLWMLGLAGPVAAVELVCNVADPSAPFTAANPFNPDCPHGPSIPATAGSFQFANSASRTPDTFVDTVLPTLRTDTFRTRVVGLLPGRSDPVFSELFASAWAGAEVQGGLLAAREAISLASSVALLGFDLIRIDSVSTLLASSVQRTVTGHLREIETVASILMFSTTYYSGDLGDCSGLIPLAREPAGFFSSTPPAPGPNLLPFGCRNGNPVATTLGPGSGVAIVNTNLHDEYARTVQTTEHWELFETW